MPYAALRRSACGFHTCYSVNIAPRLHDFELKHFVDLLLQVRAAAYLIEAANPRHEHEWQVWEEVNLPDGKILVPGVVSHCIHLVEHPELVAQRIIRFADVVGRARGPSAIEGMARESAPFPTDRIEARGPLRTTGACSPARHPTRAMRA